MTNDQSLQQLPRLPGFGGDRGRVSAARETFDEQRAGGMQIRIMIVLQKQPAHVDPGFPHQIQRRKIILDEKGGGGVVPYLPLDNIRPRPAAPAAGAGR